MSKAAAPLLQPPRQPLLPQRRATPPHQQQQQQQQQQHVDHLQLQQQQQQQQPSAPLLWVLMGVSGSGKTRTGRLLAEQLQPQAVFVDADEYHPPENIAKMRAGVALTDADRMPWLQRLAEVLAHHAASRTPAVLACSALKRSYRQLLASACNAPAAAAAPQQRQQGVEEASSHQHDIAFVLLNPPRPVLLARLQARAAEGRHFMPASLLDSQLAQLEVPDATELFASFEGDDETPQGIVDALLRQLQAGPC